MLYEAISWTLSHPGMPRAEKSPLMSLHKKLETQNLNLVSVPAISKQS